MNKRLPIWPATYQSVFLKFSLLAVTLITSCSPPDTEYVNPYSYFPIEIGTYRIYSIKEEIYSAGQKDPLKKSWKEKDEVIRQEKNPNSSVTYWVSRSVWNEKSQYWTKTKEYLIHSFPDKIIINLDGEILTPMIFPVFGSTEWDGYEYFNLNDLDPRYGYRHHFEKINEPLRLGMQAFDKTLKVSERNDTTRLTYYRLGYKYYASGIGLVLDQQTDYDYLQENGELIGYKTISSGTSRIKEIIEYGVDK